MAERIMAGSDKNENMGIYKITNTQNGKFYIGSSVDLKKRKRDHLRELDNNIHANGRMQNSFNKYGRKSFRFDIVELVVDRERLIEREQYWIDNTRAYDKSVGFNINIRASGGGNFAEDNGNFGNTGVKNPLSKQVAQINADTLEVVNIFGAGIEVWRKTGFHHGNISQTCCLVETENVWKIYKDFYWCFEKDLHKLQTKKDFSNKNNRPVLQMNKETMEVINEYKSVSEAAGSFNVGAENISRCCSGKNKTSAGFVWRYKSSIYKSKRKDVVLVGGKNPRARRVAKLSKDGELLDRYCTVAEAAEKNSVSKQALYVNLNRGAKGTRYATGGFFWAYCDSY